MTDETSQSGPHLALQRSEGADLVSDGSLSRSERLVADLVVAGVAANAETAYSFHSRLAPILTVQQSMISLRESSDRVARGDLSDLEAMLSAQAVALNAVFTDLAQRAARHLEVHKLHNVDTLMRVALRAQSQSRSTVEAIAAIKQGPPVFTRQANVSTYGQQQVNSISVSSRHLAPAKRSKSQLLEAPGAGNLDCRKARATSRAHPNVEAVGVINGPPDRRGQS